MSKNKVKSKTDNKDENSLEENINIDPNINTGEFNVDENENSDDPKKKYVSSEITGLFGSKLLASLFSTIKSSDILFVGTVIAV